VSIQSNAFRVIGGMSARLPRFRGKHRVFLALFNALGLRDKHVSVVAKLQQPVTFRARLDLHSWLQRLAYVAGEYEADTVRLLVRLGASMARPGYLLDAKSAARSSLAIP
jgi:hydroxypyruvate isomerase